MGVLLFPSKLLIWNWSRQFLKCSCSIILLYLHSDCKGHIISFVYGTYSIDQIYWFNDLSEQWKVYYSCDKTPDVTKNKHKQKIHREMKPVPHDMSPLVHMPQQIKWCRQIKYCYSMLLICQELVDYPKRAMIENCSKREANNWPRKKYGNYKDS